MREFEEFAKEEWAKIPQKTCLNLVDNYKKRLDAVIQEKKDTQLTIKLLGG